MFDYLYYTPEQLAQDDYFISWVCSTDISTEQFWQNWLETYPFKRADVETARQIVLTINQLEIPKLSSLQVESLKKSIFSTIDESANHANISVKPAKFYKKNLWLITTLAASLVIVLSVYFYKKVDTKTIEYSDLVSEASSKYNLVEVGNLSNAVQLVVLPDGSSVILKKGSKLSYPNHFSDDSREIYLTGEAFFEIAKDPSKPFYVHAHEIITKVLGTSFNVKAYPNDKQIQVSVKTGKVSVYQSNGIEAKQQANHKKLEGFVLSPNQEVIIKRQFLTFEKKNIKAIDKQAISIQNIAFEYEEVSVLKIFKDLSEAYNITIVCDENIFKNCLVTASLTDEPLSEKLKLISKSVEATYEIVNGKIIISGVGCNEQ